MRQRSVRLRIQPPAWLLGCWLGLRPAAAPTSAGGDSLPAAAAAPGAGKPPELLNTTLGSGGGALHLTDHQLKSRLD